MVFGYLSESLPEGYLNEIDLAFINRMHFKQTLDSLKSKLAGWKDKALFRTQPSPRGRKLSRDERQEALTRFILALSDQQLATGFAVLIGAIANQRSLTVYDFKITFGLAWFSATTHLATLDALRDYFIVHATVREWRIYGMVLILVLLFYCRFITLIPPDDTVPMQCLFESSVTGMIVTADHTTLPNPQPYFDGTPISLLATIFTLFILITGYTTRISWSRGRSADTTLLERFAFYLINARSRIFQLRRMNAKERNLLLREIKAAQQSRWKRHRLEGAGTSRGVRRAHFMYLHIMSRYNEAFLSLAPQLMFMISYGFAQLVFTRWTYHNPVVVEGGMGFGQITPICFLLIPFLAAAETYYGTIPQIVTTWPIEDADKSQRSQNGQHYRRISK